MRILTAFTDHPRSVGETYFQHMAFAFRFGCIMLGASLAAFVHAILPFAFEKTASTIIIETADKLRNRGR
ncbi:hypothetical protein E1162_04830 [Rhodobacteraceae bacterium RKSG542]|uniref:DUF6356 family protein n=1 Tax=Pseudovibrio flavus TaxID=2529854 RepID=UPI0012BD2B19|nr:DUF6356 family protein [Pseudovibrio flavus]MTI16562.1 hypothetical protein [Pseudovibrio flavus]